MKANLKYYRVLNMAEAIQLIEGNDLLDVRTNLALARMRSKAAVIADDFYKTINQKEMQLAEDTKDKKPEEIRKMNDEFIKQKQDSAINDDTGEYDWPDLKASQFEAQQDIVRAGGRVYKKGESLVPTKFFTLMGDLISE